MSHLSLVRIATAGSVDDGKSTLIGRLLFETDSLYDDQIQALKDATERRGEVGVNLALVTDGLRAEREQNITIDVAYRPFRSEKRRYLLADSPGHAQYTRNMVTAASTAHVVLVLCDAKRGLTTQSRRHLAVASLLKVPRIVLVVNKMDLVGFDQAVYDQFVGEMVPFGRGLGANQIDLVPVSALNGDNVVTKSANTPWYKGPSLLDLLDGIELGSPALHGSVVPVQNIHLAPKQRRFFAGTLRGHDLKIGDAITVGHQLQTRIKTLVVSGTEQAEAKAGMPVSIELEDEIDVGRGDWIQKGETGAAVAQTFEATVFWMHTESLRVGMSYRLIQGPRLLSARVTAIRSQLDLDSGTPKATGSIALNDIGYVTLELGRPNVLQTFEVDRELGSFILVDPQSMTVAAGTVDTVRPTGISDLAKEAPVVWLTGFSGSGKSTISEALIISLKAQGRLAMHLDGDLLRTGLCADLGFSPEDRMENIRRTVEVAKLFSQQGFVTICSFISPLRAHREVGYQILGESFAEVFVHCDIDECIRRDPKGLYKRALSGAISNFTGVDAPYEVPEDPALTINTQDMSVDDAVKALTELIGRRMGW